MGQVCHALVPSMAHYYYPESVQGDRWFHQKVLTVESRRKTTAVSMSLPILEPQCPKTSILPKKHHQNKTLDRKIKAYFPRVM